MDAEPQNNAATDPRLLSGIEAAFRKLPLLPDQDFQLAIAVSTIALFHGPTMPPMREFSNVGEAATRKEIRNLVVAAEALSRRLSELHSPAIDALADSGFIRGIHGGLEARLARLVEVGNRVDLSKVPAKEKGGRPRNLKARGVALVLGYDFRELTGMAPTYGPDREADGEAADTPFVGLVREVMGLLGLPSQSARRAAESAVRVMRERGDAHETLSHE